MGRSFERLKLFPARKLTPGIVCSLVLAVVMMAVFSRAASGLSHTAQILSLESRAILAMDITVTRLAALKHIDPQTASRFLSEECAAAGIDPFVENKLDNGRDGTWLLSISCQDGNEKRQLAAVEIPCPKQ